ncbi:hypothetical protein NFI96_020314, partial [Prochilodus magdalenae]
MYPNGPQRSSVPWLHITDSPYISLSLTGSNSMAAVITYIKGDTPFPEFTVILMLDDLMVGYYDSEIQVLVPRGLDEGQEDGVLDQNVIKTLATSVHDSFNHRHQYLKYILNHTDSIEVQQRLVVCELSDSDRPGQMITKNAIGGITRDEVRFYERNLTYQNSFNFPEEHMNVQLRLTQIRHENLYYPACITALRGYLQKRRHQVKRKVKPRVRLIQRRRSVSGWDGVTCLATGFYPRHINLTILRDGQPVPDHLITGGDLLPNDDGTYQMRKHLELSQEELKKQNYTCTVTHLSLDNKLDVHLDLDPGEPIGPILSSVVAALVLVCVVVVVTCMLCRRKRAGKEGDEEKEETIHFISRRVFINLHTLHTVPIYTRYLYPYKWDMAYSGGILGVWREQWRGRVEGAVEGKSRGNSKQRSGGEQLTEWRKEWMDKRSPFYSDEPKGIDSDER